MKKIITLISALLICAVNLFAKNEGTVLQDKAVLWAKNSDGVLEWINNESAYASAGTVLELVSTDIVTADLLSGGKTEKDAQFYNVKMDGKSLYIRSNRLSLGNKVAVITKNSVLFTQPLLQTFRNSYLEPGTIVVKFDDYSSPVCNFTKIEFYDEAAWTIRIRYVLDTNLSDNKADLKAIQILTKIADTKDEAIKKELVANALNLSTSTLIRPIIQKEYNKLFGIAEDFEEPEATEDSEDSEEMIYEENPLD